MEEALFSFPPLLRQYILKELCPQIVTNLTILLQSNYSTLCIYSHFLIRIAFQLSFYLNFHYLLESVPRDTLFYVYCNNIFNLSLFILSIFPKHIWPMLGLALTCSCLVVWQEQFLFL
jgi:hypothetical protein